MHGGQAIDMIRRTPDDKLVGQVEMPPNQNVTIRAQTPDSQCDGTKQ